MSKKFSSIEFNSLLKELYALQRLGIKVGLEHTERLLELCGNPQNNFKAIHLAGTNGKGSTSAMLASILREIGYKVGLYTSPHLIKFNERIRVDGIPIFNNEIVEFMSCYKDAIEKIESTFFETTTAMAYSFFSDKNVDVAIIETGLGGRLDSTNVLNPEITIITSITYDHTEILGKDLASIAFEKGGIIKTRIPLVLASQVEVVKNTITEIAKQKDAKIIYCNDNELMNIKISESGTSFVWNGKKYKTNLIGEHQARNAILAIEASYIFSNIITSRNIDNGLRKVHWPARIQKMHNPYPIYYDVAHNPNGIQILLETIGKMYSEKPIGLMALKADKELDKIIPILQNKFIEIIITSQPEAGLMVAQKLYQNLVESGIEAVIEPDIINAIELLNSKVSNVTPGLIFGSHYIGETIFNKYGFSFDKGNI